MASKHNRVQFYPTRPLMTNKEWRWRLIARNGFIVAASSEGFTTKRDAERNFFTTVRMMRDRALHICN